DDNCESAWFWKASIAESRNDATKCLRRVLAINPENEEARNALISVEAKSQASIREAAAAALIGEYGEAREIVEQVVHDSPENIDAWILKSHLSLNFDEKLEAFRKILAVEPVNQVARSGYDFLTALVVAAKPSESAII